MINQLKTLIVQGFMDVIGLYWALISTPFRIIWNFQYQIERRSLDHDTNAKSAR